MEYDSRLEALFDLILFRPASAIQTKEPLFLKDPLLAEDSLREILAREDADTLTRLVMRAVQSYGHTPEEACNLIEAAYTARIRYVVGIQGKDILGRDGQAVRQKVDALLTSDTSFSGLLPFRSSPLSFGSPDAGLRQDLADIVSELATQADGQPRINSQWFVALSEQN